MASLHKNPRARSPYWYCAFTGADGKRHFRSTKTTDKKEAWQICNAWVKSSALGNKLTPDKAREIIASGVADVLMATGQTLPTATIRDWSVRWLAHKELENKPRTHERYESFVRRFLTFLGDKTDKDLGALTVDDVLRFRDQTAKKLSVGSANLGLKVLRSCLYAAVKQGLIDKNVASHVNSLKRNGMTTRRAFSLEEVRKIVSTCAKAGGEWLGLVLTALYTGQRLGDVARLTWGQVDLTKRHICFLTEKTGKPLSLRIAPALAEYLADRPSTDDPRVFVFPTAAGVAESRIGNLSTKFYDEILAPSGLVPGRPKKHAKRAEGRNGRRIQSELSFHSFRHTLTTWLKQAGASNAIAQMIIGHDSEIVSRGYTHLSADDTTELIDRLPNAMEGIA